MALVSGVAIDGKDVSFKSEDVLYAVRLSDELPANGKHTTRLFTDRPEGKHSLTQIDLAHPFSFVRDTLAATEPELMVTTTAQSPVAGRFPDKSVIFNKAFVTSLDTSATAAGCVLTFSGTNRQNQFPPMTISKDYFGFSPGAQFWVPYNQSRVSAVLNLLPPAKTWHEREQEPEYLLSSPPSPFAIPDLGNLIRQHIPSIDGQPRHWFNYKGIRDQQVYTPTGPEVSFHRGPMGKRINVASQVAPGLKR